MHKERSAYLYRHIRLDKNEPFYIGIAVHYDSLFEHGKYKRAYSKSRNSIWKNIAKKTNYTIEIVFDDLTWEDACLKEIELIKKYGKINNNTGILANMTDGGEGKLGINEPKSPEVKAKISLSLKGRKLTKEHKKNIGISGIGIKKKMTEEHRKNISISKKGVKTGTRSEQSKINMSIAQKNRIRKPLSENHKTNIGLGNLGKKRGKYKPRIKNNKSHDTK